MACPVPHPLRGFDPTRTTRIPSPTRRRAHRISGASPVIRDRDVLEALPGGDAGVPRIVRQWDVRLDLADSWLVRFAHLHSLPDSGTSKRWPRHRFVVLATVVSCPSSTRSRRSPSRRNSRPDGVHHCGIAPPKRSSEHPCRSTRSWRRPNESRSRSANVSAYPNGFAFDLVIIGNPMTPRDPDVAPDGDDGWSRHASRPTSRFRIRWTGPESLKADRCRSPAT